jgi:hypothetical protein
VILASCDNPHICRFSPLNEHAYIPVYRWGDVTMTYEPKSDSGDRQDGMTSDGENSINLHALKGENPRITEASTLIFEDRLR